MSLTHCTPAASLDHQLRAARTRSFIGRQTELQLFRTLLGDRERVFTVLYLDGPGGIGKSTLLSRLADEAHRAGRPVVQLHTTWDGPAQVDGDAPVVLVDRLDDREQPERWLRATVLPAFPAGTVFVIGSRRPPSVRWRADLGWNDILRSVTVEPLSPDESAAMLRAHGVPDEWHERAGRLGAGNPLALRVAAQIILTDADCRTEEDLHRKLALAIFHQLIGDIPTKAHRQALEVCAHAATTNEDLLRAAVPDGDAAVLFDWLHTLPFVAPNARGVYPSEVVRHVVEAELRWRDADQYAAMHVRVKDHLIKRARSIAADAVLPYVADVIFGQRSEPRQQPFFTRLDGFEVREHHYQAADRAEVEQIALRAEGAESARLTTFWLDRQPKGFRVYRRPGDPRVIAFLGLLRVSHPADDELDTDPVVAAAWSRTQSVMPLRPGEHLAIARFSVDPASYQRPSEATDLMQLRLAATVMCDDELAWSVMVSPDPDFWAPSIERNHVRDHGPPIEVDGRHYTLFSQYFGGLPITAWSDLGDDIMLFRRPKSIPVAHQYATAWTRDEFDQAVRHTLRNWQRPDILADSRMARSRMVTETGGDDAVASLRRTFSAALETLGQDPRQAKFHRVLVGTYLDGVPTQEAAAERLGLPFSTYRRHLTRGLSGLGALLWKAETHGIGILEGG